MNLKYCSLFALAALALAGCAATQLESDYGRSVRQMINSQTYDPSTLTSPSAKPVIGAEPNTVNAAVTALQTDVSPRAEQTEQPISIRFGMGRGSR